MIETELYDFYRKDRWPHMFCPGCGIGIVMNCFFKAFSELGIDQNKTIFVSGIGCSGRIPGYIRADSLHTTHGRPIAFATGIKLSKPQLKVVVFSGDGDLGAIGGNHFIHACRRSVDLTVVCINNNVYGLTGGQLSPTTPHGYYTTTTPHGSKEYPFGLSEIAVVSGANYVARWTTTHPKHIVTSFKKALSYEGFKFVEIVSQAPICFGRMNKMDDPAKFYDWLRNNSIRRRREEMSISEVVDLTEKGKIIVGEFVERHRPSYRKSIGTEGGRSP